MLSCVKKSHGSAIGRAVSHEEAPFLLATTRHCLRDESEKDSYKSEKSVLTCALWFDFTLFFHITCNIQN